MSHEMGGAWVPGLSHGGKIYNNQEHTLGQLHKGKSTSIVLITKT